MSEDEAQRRCRAARLARQFPILLEMLAEASLHLTGILLLGPHLTDANCVELLARARFRTKREIERLVAEIAPCPDVPSRIVPLHRAGAEYWMVSPLDDDLHGPLARPHDTWAAYVRALAGDVRQLEAGLGAGQAPPRASAEEVVAAARGQAFGDAAQDGEAGVRTPALDERQEQRQHVSTPVPPRRKRQARRSRSRSNGSPPRKRQARRSRSQSNGSPPRKRRARRGRRTRVGTFPQKSGGVSGSGTKHAARMSTTAASAAGSSPG